MSYVLSGCDGILLSSPGTAAAAALAALAAALYCASFSNRSGVGAGVVQPDPAHQSVLLLPSRAFLAPDKLLPSLPPATEQAVEVEGGAGRGSPHSL